MFIRIPILVAVLIPILIPILILILAGSTSAAQAQVVLLDTFEDDTPGQAPNAPQVGTAFSLGGTHQVVGSGGDQALQSSGGGAGYRWDPVGSPSGVLRISYNLLFETGSTLVGINAFSSSIGFTTPGPDYFVGLSWGNDMAWRISTETGTIGTFQFDQTYKVEWVFDTVIDRFDLRINDQVLVSGGAAGADLTSFARLHHVSNFSTDATCLVDDMMAIDDIFSDGFESGDLSRWSNGAPPSIGDECSDSLVLTETGTQQGTLDDNTGATGDDSICGTGDTLDEWLHITASCTGTLEVTTCHTGTEFDTVLSAFDGCGGTELACNDDGVQPECDLGGNLRKSKISFPVLGGSTYWIRVGPFQDTFPAPGVAGYEISATCFPF